jgi:cytoskeleton protein RodZ
MSENFPMDQAQQAADAVVKPVTAGVLLKTAREAQGLPISALAVTLKVPVFKLEALEADRHEVLTDSVFTRALAASVCRVLKIDPAPVLAALPHSEMPRFKTDDAGLNTPFKTGGLVFGLHIKSRLITPLGLAVALLLLGILLVFMLPARELADTAPSSAAQVTDPEVLRPAPAVEPTAPPASAPLAGDLPVSLAVADVVQPSPALPLVTPDGAAAVLVLESRGASWVEITDAQGVLQLRKILAAGEQVRSQGPLPLSVVLGRADDVAVTVRGQRLDVGAMTKDNVARFEVK